MKTQKSKYQIDAIETINHIKNNYGGLDFRHDEILPYFRREKIAPVVLYNLKMANILIAKNRGVYALNKDVNLLSDNIIANKVKLSVSKINKEKKYNHQIIKQKQKTVEHLTEKMAIEFLKSKGYRVLKPDSQYGEV